VTRDLDWGIDVVEGARKKKYVWFDVLDISRLQKNGRYVKERMGTVLERSRHKLVHFIGKDNIVFTALFSLRC
jgi:methionyl-tRNA synthetase